MEDRRGNVVVVVDDDAEMNQALKRLLNAGGYDVSTFPSAEALLDEGPSRDAGCFVIDIQLPGLSGPELCLQLRRIGIKTPVIFTTAYDDQASRAHAQDAGASAYFSKPFSAKPFLSAVAQALLRE